MGRKIKVLDRDNFVDAINDYCSHKITMDEAANISEWFGWENHCRKNCSKGRNSYEY